MDGWTDGRMDRWMEYITIQADLTHASVGLLLVNRPTGEFILDLREREREREREYKREQERTRENKRQQYKERQSHAVMPLHSDLGACVSSTDLVLVAVLRFCFRPASQFERPVPVSLVDRVSFQDLIRSSWLVLNLTDPPTC